MDGTGKIFSVWQNRGCAGFLGSGCWAGSLVLEFSPRRLSVRVVFMGTPEFAVPALRHLILNDYQVVAVYTQPDRPSGRGRRLVSPPLKTAAEAFNLPVVQPPSLKTAEAVADLSCFQPDVIVVAAFGQILPQPVLELPRYGCINIHPSLLPRHRGASPAASAILAGDEFTGVSIMLMDRGLDTGPLLVSAQIPISDRDNTGSLSAKLSLIAAHLLQEVLLALPGRELKLQPQDEDKATYSGTITKDSGEIDWHQPAVAIWRRVRAFYPWPGAYTKWQGKRLKFIEAVPLSGAESANVGQVVALSGDSFGIKTGDGILGVLVVQMEGKRAMSAAEFMRGQRQFIGTVLPS
jgi:methionyl-tRNA formyltransferase